jgi:hypothetical protein
LIVFCDIDGTIADSAWREPLKSDWANYHENAEFDKPIQTGVEIVRAFFNAGHTVIASTSRPETSRIRTLKWLVTNEVQFDQLMMRPAKDYRKPVELKLSYAEVIRPDLVIDDRGDVCDAFCGIGVSTLISTLCEIRK